MPDPVPLSLLDRHLIALTERRDPRAEVLWQQQDRATQQRLLRAVSASRRSDLLFLTEDATDHVQALPPLAIYETLRAIDDVDASVLLGCASAEQVDVCLELDCQREDGLDTERFRDWLERFVASSAMARADLWRQVDLGLIASLLEPSIRDFAIPEGEDLLRLFDHCQVAFHFTPDMVRTHRGYGRDDLVDEFLQGLYALDNDLFNDLCRLLQDGEREEAEADRRERAAHRRHELHLPSKDEALVLTHPVPLPFSLPPAPATSGLPTAHDAGPAFLSQVLELATDRWSAERLDRFTGDLRNIANALSVLTGGDPDNEALAAVLDQAQSTIGLGLEYLSAGDLRLAMDLLEAEDLQQLFRTGYTLLRQIAIGLAVLPDRPRFPSGLGPLSTPGLADLLIAELGAEPPRLIDACGGSRPIACVADIRAALQLLAFLED